MAGGHLEGGPTSPTASNSINMLLKTPIKNQVWNLRIRKLLSTQRAASRKYIPLDQIRTVVVAFPADEKKDYDLSVAFIKDLLKRQVQVRGLACTMAKQRPAYIEPSLYVSVLTNKDIGWDGMPRRSHLHEFSEAEVDLFIDLNYRGEKPIMYLAAMSKARMRIGPAGAGHARFYDLMIDTRKNST